jgi:hypothetical protein
MGTTEKMLSLVEKVVRAKKQEMENKYDRFVADETAKFKDDINKSKEVADARKKLIEVEKEFFDSFIRVGGDRTNKDRIDDAYYQSRKERNSSDWLSYQNKKMRDKYNKDVENLYKLKDEFEMRVLVAGAKETGPILAEFIKKIQAM